ncbi:MAG: arginine--tRNA ligase [Acidimicrobiales bacterium]|jgi:arginyl-tRNA synthetase|nr:arginine--tRNA ligase [Acidimicrobiales bacterium]MDP6299242.1 arginine--tRNA ligase [Acidimicrobiales bacterium]HJM27792.1 arginine--tRNA ligase [Acidimicrobiales bacterium]HJM96863.1 arginine--tRNA ligase [Acidimicrobiales bacterium]
MINETIKSSLRQAMGELGISPIPSDINLERPANRDHGDWSSNLALVISKEAGRQARELADEISEHINGNLPEGVVGVSTAGPGFINFKVSLSWLYQILIEVLEKGSTEFGRLEIGDGLNVNVEFVSANPTGPLHAGHARGACYGDAIANILSAVGYSVHREFYMNDRGLQMQIYGQSLQARKEGTAVPEEGYGGEYIIEWASLMPEGLTLPEIIDWGCAHAQLDQQETLAGLGIHFDTWFSEKSMIENGDIEKVLGDLTAGNASYEKDGATWLSSTTFGDDKDRVLVKSDGELTYLTPDVAYHRNKYERADWLINVWGADHHGYVARMKAAMHALGNDPDDLSIQITQLVKLVRSGKEVKLSKRQGDIIELRSIIEEIGSDATRFMYLLQSVDSKQTFDLELAASHAMENPVYYVQMAHARLCSIGRKAEEEGFSQVNLSVQELEILTHEREIEILRLLELFPEVIDLSARELAPHKIVTWTRDFANAVHGFYHDCYVIGEDVSPKLTNARLNLVVASRIGLKVGLDLLGVNAPDKM